MNPPNPQIKQPPTAGNLRFEVTYDIVATVKELIEARTPNEAKELANRFCSECIKESRRTGGASTVRLVAIRQIESDSVVLQPTEVSEALNAKTTDITQPSPNFDSESNQPSDVPSRFADSKTYYPA